MRGKSINQHQYNAEQTSKLTIAHRELYSNYQPNAGYKQNVKNSSGVPCRRDFDLTVTNINKINGEISELLSLAQKISNRNLGKATQTNKNGEGYYEYKRNINYLQNVQKIGQNEEHQIAFQIKSQIIANNKNTFDHGAQYHLYSASQLQNKGPLRPTHRHSNGRIQDNLPISMPTKKQQKEREIEQPTKNNKEKDEDHLLYYGRSRSPCPILRPNSKYIKNQTKKEPMPAYAYKATERGNSKPKPKQRQNKKEQQYDIYQEDKQKQKQPKSPILSLQRDQSSSQTKSLSYIRQIQLEQKQSEKEQNIESNKVKLFQSGHNQQQKIILEKNANDIQLFSSFKPTSAQKIQINASNTSKNPIPRNQSQFQRIRVSQHFDNIHISQKEKNKRYLNNSNEKQQRVSKREVNGQSKAPSSKQSKVYIKHDSSQFSQQAIQGADLYKSQPPSPYGIGFELKVFPCNLNSETVKSYIADRLASVVQADTQLIQYKKLFLENNFNQKLALPQKKEKLLETLWSRGLMIDQYQLDEVVSFDVYHHPAIISNEQRASLKDFNVFIEVFVDKYLKAEYEWEKKVLHMLSQNQVKQTNFKVAKLDLQGKGYLRLEDLTCFINLYANNAPCFKNRSVKELFVRLCRGEHKQDILSYSGFLDKIMKNIQNV